jgi:hypothetical protein
VGRHEKFDYAEGQSLRFVLPYAVRISESPYFSRVPLSVICQAIGAVCHLFDLTATIHMACDLTFEHFHEVRPVEQYCYVLSDNPDQHPTMTCSINDADLSEFKDAVKPFLGAQH